MTAPRPSRPDRCPHGRWPAAFSQVELVVVLGILMVVVSLLLPSMAGSVSRTKLTRDMAALRQSALQVSQYATDHDGVYPLWGEYDSPWIAAQGWAKPMISAGYFETIQQIDPSTKPDSTHLSVSLSMCMVYDWRLMRPGRTVPMQSARWHPVRVHEVFFPSAKGVLFKGDNGIPLPDPGARSFCCTDLWIFPVAMGDASIRTGTYMTFNGDKPLWQENGIGTPVHTTWLGVRGLDTW